MQLTRQILHVIGFDDASVLMPSLVWAAGTSMPDRIDGFQVPQVVSDSVTVEFASLFDRLGAIATTTGFVLALFAPVFVLVVLAGLRGIVERTSKRTTRTRPDNVIKFEPRARSPERTPSRTNKFPSINLKEVSLILIGGFFAISTTGV